MLRPKIFVSIDTEKVGGPGKGVLQFFKSGGSELSDPLVVLFDDGSMGKWQFKEALINAGMPFDILKQRMTYDPFLIPQAYRLIKSKGVQILQSHGYKPHVLCLALKLMTGLPWIAFVHGWTAENLKIEFYAKLDRFILRFADKIVVVSNAIKNRLNLNWIDEKKIKTIYNAIEPSEYDDLSLSNDIRNIYGISEKEKIIGVVGRFSPEKGQLYFLDAFKLIKDRFANVKAMLVGDGQDKEKILQKIKEYKLEKDVILTGYQEKITQFYKAFDVVVMPSLSEGMPNVALEAMLFEKPVIATNVGGIPEVVIDKVTGSIVPSQAPELLANQIIRIIDDPNLALEYGNAGRERVLAEFIPRKRVERIIELYTDLISNKKL